jgi:AcrR family transcriptional regulator
VRTKSRAYAGRSAEQRRAERRAQLLAAAKETWGDQGWAAVTMRGVCAKAGLTNRYFYENFADRDALLAAVWDDTLSQVITRVLAAVSAAPAEPRAQFRAALAEFVHAISEDPDTARIGFGEHAGSAILEQRRRDAIRTFTDLIIAQARHTHLIDTEDTAARMTALLLVGGLTEIITNWLHGELPADTEQLITHMTNLAVILAPPILNNH